MSGLKSICLFCLAFLCIACATTPSKKVKTYETYEDIYGNSYEYEFLSSGEGTHTITGTKFPIPEGIQIRRFTGTTNEIEIPQQIEKRQVVRISPSAFSKKQLINVIIPDTVAVIFPSAFSNNQLTNVTIPGSVYAIGDWAFENNQLTNVSFNNGIAIIALEAFRNNQLTRVTIPQSVNEIGDYAFAGNPLRQISVMSSISKDKIGWAALGSLTPTFIMNGCLPGTYTKQGLGWFLNDKRLPGYAAIKGGKYIFIVSIDEETIEKNFMELIIKNYNKFIDKKTFLEAIKDLNKPKYLPAGEHTITVIYYEDRSIIDGRPRSSTSTVTFKENLFEGGNYTFTGKIEGGQVRFRMESE